MKTLSRLIVITIVLLLSMQGVSQVPQKINYQAVAHDASGNPICDQTLGIKFSIREGSATDLTFMLKP